MEKIASELYAWELRSEVLSIISAANEERRGALDRLEIGSGSGEHGSTDVVAGTETVTVGGDLTETVGRERTSTMHSHTITVHGHKHLQALQETELLTGTFNETHRGGELLVAGMSDDLIAGIGVRTTAPADLWLNGLIGMEEKLATANNDGLMIDVYAVGMEREFGTSIHNLGVASIGGAVYTTAANGFMQLHQIQRGLRNTVPGGGGGSGNASSGAPAPAGTPPPASSPAPIPASDGGASNIASMARTGRGVDDLASAEDLANARQATEAVETSSTVRPNVAEALQNLRDADEAARQGSDDAAAAALRRASEELSDADFDDIDPLYERVSRPTPGAGTQASPATDAAAGATPPGQAAIGDSGNYSPGTPTNADEAAPGRTTPGPNGVQATQPPPEPELTPQQKVRSAVAQQQAELRVEIDVLRMQGDLASLEVDDINLVEKADLYDHIRYALRAQVDPRRIAEIRIQEATVALESETAYLWQTVLGEFEEILKQNPTWADESRLTDSSFRVGDPPLHPKVDKLSVEEGIAHFEVETLTVIDELPKVEDVSFGLDLQNLYTEVGAYTYIRHAVAAGQDPVPGIKRFINEADAAGDIAAKEVWAQALVDYTELAVEYGLPQKFADLQLEKNPATSISPSQSVTDAVDAPPPGSTSAGEAVTDGTVQEDVYATVNKPPQVPQPEAEGTTGHYVPDVQAELEGQPPPLPPRTQDSALRLDGGRLFDADNVTADAGQSAVDGAGGAVFQVTFRPSGTLGPLDPLAGSDEILASGRLDANPGKIAPIEARAGTSDLDDGLYATIREGGIPNRTGTTRVGAEGGASDPHQIYDDIDGALGGAQGGANEPPPLPAGHPSLERNRPATTNPAEATHRIPGSERPPASAPSNPRPGLSDDGAAWSDDTAAASRRGQAANDTVPGRNADVPPGSQGDAADGGHPFTSAANPHDAPVLQPNPEIPVVAPPLPTERVDNLRADPRFDDQWGRLVHRREVSHQYSRAAGKVDLTKMAMLGVDNGLHRRAYDGLQTTVNELDEASRSLLAPYKERYGGLIDTGNIPLRADDVKSLDVPQQGFLDGRNQLRLHARDQYLEVMDALATAIVQDDFEDVEELLSLPIKLDGAQPSLRNRALALLDEMEQALAAFDADAHRRINQAIAAADEADGWQGIPLADHIDFPTAHDLVRRDLLYKTRGEFEKTRTFISPTTGKSKIRRFRNLRPDKQAKFITLGYEAYLYRRAVQYLDIGINPLPYLQEEIVHATSYPVGPLRIGGETISNLEPFTGERGALVRVAEKAHASVADAINKTDVFRVYENVAEGEIYQGVKEGLAVVDAPLRGYPETGGFVGTLDSLRNTHLEGYQADPRHAASARMLLTAEQNAIDLANTRYAEALRAVGAAEPPPNLSAVEVRGRLLRLREQFAVAGSLDQVWEIDHTIRQLDFEISSLASNQINAADALARGSVPPLPDDVDAPALIADLRRYEEDAGERARQLAIRRRSDYDEGLAEGDVFFPGAEAEDEGLAGGDIFFPGAEAEDDVVSDELARELGAPSAAAQARWQQAERAYQHHGLYAAMIEEVRNGRDPRYILDQQIRLAQDSGAEAGDIAELQRIHDEVRQAFGTHTQPTAIPGAAALPARPDTRPIIVDAATPNNTAPRAQVIADSLRSRTGSTQVRSSSDVAAILDAIPGASTGAPLREPKIHADGLSVVVSGIIGTPVRLDEAEFGSHHGHVAHIETHIHLVRNHRIATPREEPPATDAEKEDLLFARSLANTAAQPFSTGDGLYHASEVEFLRSIGEPRLELDEVFLRIELQDLAEPTLATPSQATSRAIPAAAAEHFRGELWAVALTYLLGQAGRARTTIATLVQHAWSQDLVGAMPQDPATLPPFPHATDWSLLHALRARQIPGHAPGPFEEAIVRLALSTGWGGQNLAGAFHGWFDDLMGSSGHGTQANAEGDTPNDALPGEHAAG